MAATPIRISIIIRFRNEAAFLPAVLAAAAAQEVPEARVRIIGINNGSDDESRAIAQRMCDRVLEIDDYMPGAAINLAMREEPCDFASVLSAHTIPASNRWLKALLEQALKPETLGVYGAQLYPVNSRFLDKRDLDIFSTRKPRIESRDSDFWNANSMFPRASWEKLSFDERTFELEDHYWTKCQLNGTNVVRFVPEALVYHYTHISRNDRIFLPSPGPPDAERLAAAVSALDDPNAEWPKTMMAALTVKTLHLEPGAGAAIPALQRHLAEHSDFDVRWRMAGALSKLPDAGAIEQLITSLSDPSFYARDEAAWALAELGTIAAPRLLARLHTVPKREWPLAALALGRSGHPDAERKAIELIDNGLSDTEGSLQREYMYAAGELDTASDLTPIARHLNRLLEAPDSELRSITSWAAGSLSSRLLDRLDWTAIRATAASDPDPLVRVEAIAALGKSLLQSVDPAAAKSICDAVRDPNCRVRYVAVQSARVLAESEGIFLPIPNVPSDEDHGVRFEGSLLAEARTEEYAAGAIGRAL